MMVGVKVCESGKKMSVMLTDLENKRLIEHWVQCLAMNFGLVLLLLVWHDVDLDVRIRCSRHVHTGQVCSLDHSHRQLNINTNMYVLRMFEIK